VTVIEKVIGLQVCARTHFRLPSWYASATSTPTARTPKPIQMVCPPERDDDACTGAVSLAVAAALSRAAAFSLAAGAASPPTRASSSA
jgi:hypothetical protein